MRAASRPAAAARERLRQPALLATADNHNSVNGIREFARAKGARTAAAGRAEALADAEFGDLDEVPEGLPPRLAC
jgi:hypothetical protein